MFRIAELYGQQGSGAEPADTTLPDGQAIGYDVFLEDDGIERFEPQNEAEPGFSRLVEQHRAYNRSESWGESEIKRYGEPPFPDRRLFIEYGGGPHITLTIHFSKPASRHGGYCYRDRSRRFVPRSYPGDELIHYRITREQLKEWIYEFVPGDPNRLRSRDDIDFTTGGEGHEQLKQRAVRYFDSLPDVKARRYTDDGRVRSQLSRRCVFEPSYVAGLLDVSGWYAADICRELCSEDWSPMISLAPPDDQRSFEYHPFVIGHQAYWRGTEEYDYSTWKYEVTSRVTSDPITID